MQDVQAQVVPSTTGAPTPFAMAGFSMSAEVTQAVKARINEATKAKPEQYTDVTPIYWEAASGEQKTMMFLGWKEANKKDERTGEIIEKRFMPVFFDGARQVVMGQLAIVDAMLGKPTDQIYRITCTEAAKGKAKKFTVEHFNQ